MLQNPTRRHKTPTNTNTTRGLPRTRGSSGWIRPPRRVAAPRARPDPHTLAEAQLHTQATGPERDKAETDRTDNCMHMQFSRTSAQQNALPGPNLPARRDCGRRENGPGQGTNRRPGEGGRRDRAVTCRARGHRTHSGRLAQIRTKPTLVSMQPKHGTCERGGPNRAHRSSLYTRPPPPIGCRSNV